MSDWSRDYSDGMDFDLYGPEPETSVEELLDTVKFFSNNASSAMVGTYLSTSYIQLKSQMVSGQVIDWAKIAICQCIVMQEVMYHALKKINNYTIEDIMSLDDVLKGNK